MSNNKLEFTIRKLTIEDANHVLNLKRNSISQLNAGDYTPKQIQALTENYLIGFCAYEIEMMTKEDTIESSQISENKSNNLSGIIACTNNQIIGYASISNLDLFNKFQTLYELFVHPDYARLGVGSKLLQTLENNAINRGCQIINLYSSLTAIKFYIANGYEFKEKVMFDIADTSIPVAYMEKYLVNSSIIINKYYDTSQQNFVRNLFDSP